MEIAVVGGGLTGMSAALRLAEAGIGVTLFESDCTLGGVAGSFVVEGTKLEKFYHHIFTSDVAVTRLISELDLGGRLEWYPTTTSYYYSGQIYRLAAPWDLLFFRPLPLIDRLRFGFLVVQARLVRDWRELEDLTAREWLIKMAGQRVYGQVWEPMLRGKFGSEADRISAVWMWNKLMLRGGSRDISMREKLGYLRGGFGLMVDAMEEKLRRLGVIVHNATPVSRIDRQDSGYSVTTSMDTEGFDEILVTTAPAIFADMVPWMSVEYLKQLRSIEYLANICVILSMENSLSDVYWLNISDNTIPFVGLVEHTNIQRPEQYGGAHLVYLTRYCRPDDPYYGMHDNELLQAYLPHVQRIFPQFDQSWVKRAWVWRERYAQPVTVRHYSDLKLPFATPSPGLWLCSMSQVYPEDRGMNYAVDYGERVAREILKNGGQ